MGSTQSFAGARISRSSRLDLSVNRCFVFVCQSSRRATAKLKGSLAKFSLLLGYCPFGEHN